MSNLCTVRARKKRVQRRTLITKALLIVSSLKCLFLAPIAHGKSASKSLPVDDEPRRVLARHRVFADTLHPCFAFFKNRRVRVFRSHDLDELHHLHRVEEV